jgi:hypothetical protein
MLADVQRGLEQLYRIDTELDVRDFVVDNAARAELAPGLARTPREQLLVAERDGEVELALFVDERVLANLAANDPRARLDDANLADFLLTVEGVSHFVYLAWRARRKRPVSALELELQAEIDKYVTCLLLLWPKAGAAPADLRTRLFDAFELAPDLDGDERDRYLAANSNARAYAARLDARYLTHGRLFAMLDELRWFWRLGLRDKLAFIAA